ncbi:hypothetical protein B0G62_101287 [Paraburkholderia eburnea]|uniref:Transferase family hexapeptide repeat protein n=1 Tax=Paraburkholderia eburnea TaxID=1189126 RepID=A0A2S4MMJ1_9BURK|nr:hypothetical protein [Paraburkholderia eburnea]POR55891.1 hypothetical protein B0G62_101287 [Paraburkholderia eburnea]PRZ27018.1 hypothetical protein BX588_101286 [Paraburkholderia eburnea]
MRLPIGFDFSLDKVAKIAKRRKEWKKVRIILLNNGTRELFDRRNIRLEPYFDRQHWRGRVSIEEYASFKTDFLHTSGAFSYSFSTLPADTVVGRYCSIAHEVRGFADSHPTNYISTHPFLTDGGEWHDKAHQNGSDWAERLHHTRDYGPIEIGHDVWIGRGAQIKGGASRSELVP